MKLLITGGAGYIGSVVASRLIAAGHEVTVLDDLTRGHEEAVPEGARLVRVDLRDAPTVHDALADGFDGAMHFAALALVGESVRHPERYWHTNVIGTRNLLDGLREHGVGRLVFSSTCATYGDPERLPMDEETPTRPTNPYGASKLAVDMMIHDECVAHGLAAASLRYFNVAGASGPFGEDHDPESHIVPNVLRAALGRQPRVELYGTEYPTEDGTAVRDYIHVEDLAEAHALALDAVEPGRHRIYNLGNGEGFSVRDVIRACEEVTGRTVEVVEMAPRPGDPPRLVASSARIREELGWQPHKPDLHTMIADAWAWHRGHPQGYAPAG